MKKINCKLNKLNKINILAFALCLVFASFFLNGCASSPKQEKDAYYEENLKDFSTYKLTNGIPVIIKKSGTGQIFVLRTVFEGGTPLIEPSKSGIEKLTLDLMFHGSENYSYEDILNMQYNISFSMNSSSGRDYSVAGIKCLEKDLDSVLTVYSDSILNPAFSESDFKQFMINENESLVRTLSDPSGQLSIEMEKAVFGQTSYSASANITQESINSISLNDVLECHKKLLDSSRIKFVVVANLDQSGQKKLVEKLDHLFGSIPKGEYSAPVVNKISVSGEDIFLKNKQAGTSAYSVGVFDSPERYDEDYVPFAISLMYLDDIFFDEVREKAGAVYSIGTGVLGGKEMLGAISAYKISDLENIHELIYTAIDHFPYESQIEQKLEQYKNKYITTLFDSSQNAAGVAANIITSLEYSGEPETYLKRSAQVQAVTAKDVREAYEKYLSKENKILWITVSQ